MPEQASARFAALECRTEGILSVPISAEGERCEKYRRLATTAILYHDSTLNCM